MVRSALVLLIVAAAACGAEIPRHNGYRTDHAKPWLKAKQLHFDDQNLAKAKGDLSYPDMQRAAWYEFELTAPSDVDIAVDVTPPGTEVDDNFDLGVELFDPGWRKLITKDLEEGDQQGEEKKQLHAKDLPAGRYDVHLYLQARLDTADYALRVTIKPSPASVTKSDFPALVPFLPTLPMVPVSDDTPKGYHPPVSTPVVITHTAQRPGKKEPAPPPPSATLSARIINLAVVSGGTMITVARGTGSGAQNGMHGKVNAVPAGTFVLGNCTERTCTAIVAATPDQIKSSGSVVLTP